MTRVPINFTTDVSMHMLIYRFNFYVNYRRHHSPSLVTCTSTFCFETFQTFLVSAQSHWDKV